MYSFVYMYWYHYRDFLIAIEHFCDQLRMEEVFGNFFNGDVCVYMGCLCV
jgi:hypothetical protein